MNRKLILWIFAALLLIPASHASAQQAGKVHRIGYLSLRNGIEPREQALLSGLRELGYVEGQNIAIDWRFAKGKADLLPKLADEVVRQSVDVIISAGTETTRVAKKATSTIPIIMGTSVIQLKSGSWRALPVREEILPASACCQPSYPASDWNF